MFRNNRRGWCGFCALAAAFSIAVGFFLWAGVVPAKAQLVVDAGGRVLNYIGGSDAEENHVKPGWQADSSGWQTAPTPIQAAYGIAPEGFAWDPSTQQMVPVWLNEDPDPFADDTITNDRGIRATSAATGAVGPAIGSRTTDVGGGADGSFPYQETFSPGVNQTVTVGGLLRYDSIRTSFYDGAFTAIPQTARQGIYTTQGTARYQVGNTYLDGYVSGNWGSGNVSGSVTAGNFTSRGGSGGVSIGHTFSPFAPSMEAAGFAVPTKAPPKPIIAASPLSALQIDVSANLGYATNTVNAFTDNAGFAWGDETVRYWQAGGQATFFERIIYAGYAMTPSASVGIESQFDFSHTLGIPAQPAFAVTADTLSLGSAQTFWTERVGMNVTDPNGWQWGLQGFYSDSAEYRVYGIQGSVHLPIAHWLGWDRIASR